MAKKILLLKTGSTHASIRQAFGDFEHWFLQALEGNEVQLVNAVTDPQLPDPVQVQGVILTGSPAMVTDREPWSERLAHWLANSAHGRVPVLGVCYGHQLLAHALGGAVDWHPLGRESGTATIELTPDGKNDPLLGILPPRFLAQVTHAQRVTRLPADAVLLAANTFESHHAFRIGAATWGVQFHPEFSADVMRAYLQLPAPAPQQEQQQRELLAAVTAADANASLLKRFVALL